MTLRATLLLLLFTVLTGCVTTGDVNPMRTDKGRDAARDAYISWVSVICNRAIPVAPSLR